MMFYKFLQKIKRLVMTSFRFGFLGCFLFSFLVACSSRTNTAVLVVGGGTSGVSAALSSARAGVATTLLVEGPWLGGMLTSAGVSAIDGNAELPSGFWGEFRDSLIARYGSAKALQSGWVSNHLFDPEVGAQIFQNMVNHEPLLEVHYHQNFKAIAKRTSGLWEVKTQDDRGRSNQFVGKIIIDATELGDVAAAAGIPYQQGMDSTRTFDEQIAPENANDIIQDLTYVMILKDYGKKVLRKKPKDYDPSLFYCAAQYDLCDPKRLNGRVLWSKEKMMSYGQLPSGNIMVNWPIFGNDYYVNAIEMSEEDRQAAFQKAKDHSLAFLYFLQTELGYDSYDLSDSTFPTQDSLPLIPYHRESRRIEGVVTFSLNDLAQPYNQNTALYRTGVAVGDYPVDHHHDRHPEVAQLPKLYFYPIPSYTLPLGSLLPATLENFIVAEKSISVSNLVNGTTRLQPVVLQIGQVAGSLAALSILENATPKSFSIRKLQQHLLDVGGYLQPHLDVPKTHPSFQSFQRIGSTGILRAIGKNEGWKNQMWFYPEQSIAFDELQSGLADYIDLSRFSLPETLTQEATLNWLMNVAAFYRPDAPILKETDGIRNLMIRHQMPLSNPNNLMTRGQFAVLIDQMLDPFTLKQVSHTGALISNE